MKAFENYLRTGLCYSEKKIPYYLSWVNRYLRFCKCGPESPAYQIRIPEFLSRLSTRVEDWQVQQAREAVRLCLYYTQKSEPGTLRSKETDAHWKAAVDKMKNLMGVKSPLDF